jgi:hypothetical protein
MSAPSGCSRLRAQRSAAPARVVRHLQQHAGKLRELHVAESKASQWIADARIEPAEINTNSGLNSFAAGSGLFRKASNISSLPEPAAAGN